jgi:membrane fusion protein (multidrug efflux system)
MNPHKLDAHHEAGNRQERNRRMRWMLLFLGILFGLIILYKTVIHFVIKHSIASQSHVVVVSSMKVGTSSWQSEQHSVGSVRAIKGVNVTTQLAGMVQNIYFTPGEIVKKGTLLVQLNIDPDVAQLHALQATESLDLITYNRDKKQFQATAISKEQLDTDLATWQNMHAQVVEQAANIAKKIIYAPFDGRIGVCIVSPGQYLNPGDQIATLQQLDPIYVDFYMPQQVLSDLSMGQTVNIASDSYANVAFVGKITTINPLVATDTRNVEVEATVANPNMQLVPGMFTGVNVIVSDPKDFITVPQTAITFNPYGNIVYIITHGKNDDGKDVLTVKQRFVTTGKERGEQITVLTGLKAGEEIVTSGQLKLKNNDSVKIDNSITPSNSANPNLPNNH